MNIRGEMTAAPPVGSKPRRIWVELRILDLLGAIARYVNERQPVPAAWTSELAEHCAYLAAVPHQQPDR